LAQLRTVPKQFSWIDQRLVREHYIDALSHQACTLYLFLPVLPMGALDISSQFR
jgi:hypothetical protein